jgi:hypothetical protein
LWPRQPNGWRGFLFPETENGDGPNPFSKVKQSDQEHVGFGNSFFWEKVHFSVALG